MNILKNLTLAFVISLSPVFAATETDTVIRIISVIVLPVLFFAVGKTVDVLVQVYLRKPCPASSDSRGKHLGPERDGLLRKSRKRPRSEQS